MRFIQTGIKLAAVCALSLICCTDSLEALAASVKATGMGQVGIAYPQDALAAAYNPAGIVRVCDRFDFGSYVGHFDGVATAEGNSHPQVNGSFNSFRRHNFYSGDFGIIKNFCLCECPFAASFVAYQKDFTHPNYAEALPLLGTTHAELEFVSYVFSTALAIQLADHTIGFSIDVYQNHFKVDGLESQVVISSRPGQLTNNGGQTEYGVGATIGWQWEIFDGFLVGLRFKPQTHIEKFHKYAGFLPEHGRFDTPQSIMGGIAWSFIPEASIVFDVEHRSWHRLRAVGNKLEPALDKALAGNTKYFLGQRDGPGFGWHSSMLYRVGLDWQIFPSLTLRAGWINQTTPIRSSQTAINLLTMVTARNSVTCGATFTFHEVNELSAFYAHDFKSKVNGSKNSIPETLGGGRINLVSQLNAFGFSYGRYF